MEGIKYNRVLRGVSMVSQQIKDLALPLLWHGFDHWPKNLCKLSAQQKKKKKKREKERENRAFFQEEKAK